MWPFDSLYTIFYRRSVGTDTISNEFWDIKAQTHWDHDHDLSRSRDVIDHAKEMSVKKLKLDVIYVDIVMTSIYNEMIGKFSISIISMRLRVWYISVISVPLSDDVLRHCACANRLKTWFPLALPRFGVRLRATSIRSDAGAWKPMLQTQSYVCRYIHWPSDTDSRSADVDVISDVEKWQFDLHVKVTEWSRKSLSLSDALHAYPSYSGPELIDHNYLLRLQ